LMGDVGSGKSTICEKVTGRVGLSSPSSTSFTRDSKVFLVDNKYWLADTPGLNSSTKKLHHALNLLGALRYRPITSILVICSMKDRIDGLIESLTHLIDSFYEDFESIIAVIVTKHDLYSHISKEEIQEALREQSIKNIMVTEKSTTKSELLEFLNGLTTNVAVEVNIESKELTSYFNLADADLKLRVKYNKYVKHYKEMAESGIKHLDTLDMTKKMDFAFSFKAMMYDLIPELQMQFVKETGSDPTEEKALLWTIEMKKDMKRQLLVIRLKCKEYIYSDDKSTYRKCPFCQNVWVLAQGCEGSTTCGSIPSLRDSRDSFDIFKWDLNLSCQNGFKWESHNVITRAILNKCEAAAILKDLQEQGNNNILVRMMKVIQEQDLINLNDTEIQEMINKMEDSEVKDQLLQMISQPNINIREMLSHEYYSFLMRYKQERDKKKRPVNSKEITRD